jgi:hypothetical protein
MQLQSGNQYFLLVESLFQGVTLISVIRSFALSNMTSFNEILKNSDINQIENWSLSIP